MSHTTPETAPPKTDQPDVATLQAENASLHDRLLRALAEVENTRHAAERRGDEARRYAIADFARHLLQVADNLQRAIEAAQDRIANRGADDPLLQGVRATKRILEDVFERFHLRKIKALGAPFDPAHHEAVVEVDDPAHEPGHVVQVLEDGYRLHDRLLRPARVVVARGRMDGELRDDRHSNGRETHSAPGGRN